MTIYHPGLHIEYEALCKAGKEGGYQPGEFKSSEFDYSFVMRNDTEGKRLMCDFGAELQDIMAMANEYYCNTFEEVYYFKPGDEATAVIAEQELYDIFDEWECKDKFNVLRDGIEIHVTLR